jgi:hypothetical protein
VVPLKLALIVHVSAYSNVYVRDATPFASVVAVPHAHQESPTDQPSTSQSELDCLETPSNRGSFPQDLRRSSQPL